MSKEQADKIEKMLQNLGEKKNIQSPIMMQNVLGMLGPQIDQSPNLADLMQPKVRKG